MKIPIKIPIHFYSNFLLACWEGQALLNLPFMSAIWKDNERVQGDDDEHLTAEEYSQNSRARSSTHLRTTYPVRAIHHPDDELQICIVEASSVIEVRIDSHIP